jgi:putative phosphoribosyl transferase
MQKETPIYRDRVDAGVRLASLLGSYRQRPYCIVLALPRGGVPVGSVIARELGLPLDVLLVRKLGLPGHEEYAMGAIASGGVRVLNSAVDEFGVSRSEVERVAQREQLELARREAAYRRGRPPLRLDDSTAILVDDGLATGASMRAALVAAWSLGARAVVVAVPVGSAEACDALRAGTSPADDVICADTPSPFGAVGAWYGDFTQTSDEEVLSLLSEAAHAGRDGPAG